MTLPEGEELDLGMLERHLDDMESVMVTGMFVMTIADGRALIQRVRDAEESARYANARLDDCEHTPPNWGEPNGA